MLGTSFLANTLAINQNHLYIFWETTLQKFSHPTVMSSLDLTIEYLKGLFEQRANMYYKEECERGMDPWLFFMSGSTRIGVVH